LIPLAQTADVARPSLDSVRGFDRAVYAVAAVAVVNVFGYGLVYPFATVHFHLRLGVPLSLVGLGLGANGVATGVGNVLGGYLSDRRGRRPVMVASMATSAVTLAAYAFVPSLARLADLSTGWAFVGVAAAAGVTAGLYVPAAQALTADLTGPGDRDGAFALLKVASNAGFGAGFVAGGVLYEYATTAVFLFDGATSGIVALLLLVVVPRVHDGRDGDATLVASLSAWRRAVTKRRVAGLAVINVGFAVMYAQMGTTVPVVATETLGLSAGEMGTLFVLNPLTLVLVQVPLVDAVAGWRRTRGLVVSAALWAAAMLAVLPASAGLLAGAAGVALVGGHLVVRTVGEALHSPLVTSLASDLGGTTERGSQLSLLEVAKRAGMGVGSFLGGVFFDYGLADALWPTLVVGCAGLAAGLLLLERRLSPAENGVAAD
jgi:MFS family permease